MGELSTKKKEAMYSLMDQVSRALDKEDVMWWASYNTLLGAIRHGAIVPWEKKMEIQTFVGEIPKLQRVFSTQSNLHLQRTPYGYKVASGDEVVEIHLMRKSMNYIVRSTDEWAWGQERYESNFLFPLIKYKYGPLFLWGPRQPHEWLWRWAGMNYDRIGVVNPPNRKPYRIKLIRN